MLAWLKRTVAPWSSRVLDGVVFAYAAFTLCSHAVMLGGGTPRTLAWLAGAACVVGLAAAAAYAVWSRRRSDAATESGAPAEGETDPEPETETESFDRRRLLLLALGLLVFGVWSWLRDPLVLWLGLLAYLVLGYVDALRADVMVPAAPRAAPLWSELVLFGLAALSALVAVTGHRFRNDDCYYINLAVTVVESPDAPLLDQHSIHEPLPDKRRSNNVFKPYRVHSWEVLGGVLGLAFGSEPIEVIHVAMAALAAALIPLAFARLFRMLDPRRWLFMLLAAMALYLFEGSSGLGFASQGIVRSFTGKSVLLSVVVPLLVHHAIVLAARPSRLAFVRLMAAQVAAIGLSSTALWLAPVATMLATAVPLAPRLRSLRAIGVGLLSCSYVVALGLVIRAQLMGHDASDPESGAGGAAAAAVSVKAAGAVRARFDLVRKGLEQAFEEPQVITAFVCVLMLAVVVAPTRVARRYVAIFCGALAVFLMNPYLANFVRHNLTGEYTGQRAMWLAPVPTAFALVFAALLPATAPRAIGWLRTAAATLALAVFLTLVPTRAAISRANGVRWAWPPGLKVPGSAFKVVRSLHEQLQVGDVVLAPELVSWYLPTLTHHPYPLLACA